MLTKTLPLPEDSTSQTLQRVEQQVDERGFSLYEWISPSELRMSILSDYLGIMRSTSIPLAVVTVLAGLIGLSLGPVGVFVGVILVLLIFYAIVGVILIAKMLHKAYLYTRGGSIVVTDKYYAGAGTVVDRSDKKSQKKAFQAFEETFREPLLGSSELAEYIAMQKKTVGEQLKTIVSSGGDILSRTSRSRDSNGVAVALIVAGALYAAMMAVVYYVGVFFVSLLARIFAWIAHRILLATNNTEHTIQTLFNSVDRASHALQGEKGRTINLLTEAGQNEWANNLKSRIESSFSLMSESASLATNESIKLKKLLESSKYRDLFNFGKYGNWIKTQVVEPIDEIYGLLLDNRHLIEKTQIALENQIQETTDPSLKLPLELQKDRLYIHIDSLDNMIRMLNGYREKLKN